MKPGALLFSFLLAAISCIAETSPAARRDNALKKVDACVLSKSGRECNYMGDSIQILVDIYKGGDKSVLPALLHFTYLSDFYDEALLSDRDSVLMAVNQLPEKQQREVAMGIAGGYFRTLSKSQFDAVRTSLVNIPDSSPTKQIAEVCLKALEANNASLFLSYFPPQTFTRGAGNVLVSWYSSELYSLGERPLWPASAPNLTVYRFTYIPAFAGPETVVMTVLPDGTGAIKIKALDAWRQKMEIDDSKSVTVEQVTRFFGAVKRAEYWQMPTEVPSRGRDGAQWILEGIQDGDYKIVTRWCPGFESQDQQGLAYANSARILLEFAGHKF